MAAHPKPLIVCGLVLAVQMVAAQEPIPQRVVSLVPAVTEMLFAVGAGTQVVGMGSFDEIPKDPDGRDRTAHVARVGGLLDPDLERIFTLRPDLVVLYASQTDAREQLARAGVPVLPYEHGGLAGIPHTLRDLGRRTGHVAAASAAADRLEGGLAAIQARVAGRSRPRTLLVFGREPMSMRNVYASGGIGFLHDMLDIAGGENVFGHVQTENVAQVSSEAIISAAPDIVIEVRYGGSLTPEMEDAERNVWRQLSTLPAVRTDRVHLLTGSQFVVPGPRVVEATEALARALHPEAF